MVRIVCVINFCFGYGTSIEIYVIKQGSLICSWLVDKLFELILLEKAANVCFLSH